MKWAIIFIGVLLPIQAECYVNLSGAWFGNGGYKVSQQDLWPNGTCSTCAISPNWDGTNIKMAGFHNEMIGGMLWLQGGASNASSVSVSLSPISGPGGSVISSTDVLCASVTNYANRDVEVFVSTYVQIQGMSETQWPYQPYEERDVPPRFQNPYTVNGNNDGICNGSCLWSTRPDANKFFPDALIPEECETTFPVAASTSQGVWIDIYLRKALTAGFYSGTLNVYEGVTLSTAIPIHVTVYSGTLPDQPNYNYITDVNEDNINYRLNGIAHGAGCATAACVSTDEAFYQALHRHRMIPIGDEPDVTTSFFPSAKYQLMLSGNLFTSSYGYQGPGIGTGLSIYSIGTYGQWTLNPNWSQTNSTLFSVATSSWGAYFKNNYPGTRSFVYLADEPSNLTLTNEWSTWMSTISAAQTSGYTVNSWVTNKWVLPLATAPYINMPASTGWYGPTGYTQTNWISAAAAYETTGSTQGWAYNGHPPTNGTPNATEDDGVSAWEGVWADYVKGVQGHFQWQTDNWYNPGNQTPFENPLWNQAKTFGYDSYPSTSASFGHYGYNYGNGDGVWMYPGTEVSTYTAANLGFLGPVMSLRAKLVRRSINDYDYLKTSYAINPSSTTAIVETLVPKALWDITCFTSADCTYHYGGRPWDLNPSDWETARQNLATIISGSGPLATFNGALTVNGGVLIQ
jgi:hypothetical protein